MNRNEFTAELKELMLSMDEDEIERTINALNGCRAAVRRRSDAETADKIRLVSTTSGYRAEMRYVPARGKGGTLKIYGASLLTAEDHRVLRGVIPNCKESWWLFDKCRMVTKNEVFWTGNSEKTTAKVRPVLVIEKVVGDLEPGNIFYVNGVKFKLLTPSLAIKTSCLEDACTYYAMDYESSLLKLCVDGWYWKLIRESGQPDGTTPA